MSRCTVRCTKYLQTCVMKDSLNRRSQAAGKEVVEMTLPEHVPKDPTSTILLTTTTLLTRCTAGTIDAENHDSDDTIGSQLFSSFSLHQNDIIITIMQDLHLNFVGERHSLI